MEIARELRLRARFALAQQTTIGRDGESIALYLAWASRHVMSVLACSGIRGSWTWEDAAKLASIQGRHIDEAI